MGNDKKKAKRSALMKQVQELTRQNERLEMELTSARTLLGSREVIISEAGSLAEASLKLNGVMEAAQAAADQYLDNIKKRYAYDEEASRQIREDSQEQAKRVVEEAQARAREVSDEARARARRIVDEAREQAQRLTDNAQGAADDVRGRADTLVSEAESQAARTEEEARERAQQLLAEADERMGRAEQEARQKADDILAQAQEQARDLVADAEQRAQEAVSTAEQRARERVDEAEGQAENLVAEARREAAQLSADAERKARELEEAASKRAAALNEEARRKAEEIEASARSRMAERMAEAERVSANLEKATRVKAENAVRKAMDEVLNSNALREGERPSTIAGLDEAVSAARAAIAAALSTAKTEPATLASDTSVLYTAASADDAFAREAGQAGEKPASEHDDEDDGFGDDEGRGKDLRDAKEPFSIPRGPSQTNWESAMKDASPIANGSEEEGQE